MVLKFGTSLFLVLFFGSVSYAVEVCGTRTVLNISQVDSNCGGSATCSLSWLPSGAPSGCTSTLSTAVVSDCVCNYQICCDNSVTPIYEDGIITTYNIAVSINDDYGAVARAEFDSYVGAISLPIPAPGYVLTGSLSGMAYDVMAGMDGTGTMRWTGYKRGSYTALPGDGGGTLTPTPLLGGGTGGTGGTGSGLTLAETQDAVHLGVSDAMNEIGTGVYVVPEYYDNPAIPDSGALTAARDSSVSGIQSDFIAAMNTIKTSSLFSLPLNLTNNLPVAGTPVISFNAGVFGSHTYDFGDANWSWVLLVLRSILLIAFSYVGIKIVVLKGGGG